MPVIKSAIKKLRKDRVREIRNDEFRKQLRDALRAVKKTSADSTVLQTAYSLVDKAAKRNLLHPNKAARMKSQIAKSIKSAPVSKAKKSASA
ncbi:MAG TPA: 30S ribosomal protein S20 [Candidatus Levybacteria bacterium]|nr:30S ribosomal protein S20 [Candidatus Levybacteria bacterium]